MAQLISVKMEVGVVNTCTFHPIIISLKRYVIDVKLYYKL